MIYSGLVRNTVDCIAPQQWGRSFSTNFSYAGHAFVHTEPQLDLSAAPSALQSGAVRAPIFDKPEAPSFHVKGLIYIHASSRLLQQATKVDDILAICSATFIKRVPPAEIFDSFTARYCYFQEPR